MLSRPDIVVVVVVVIVVINVVIVVIVVIVNTFIERRVVFVCSTASC